MRYQGSEAYKLDWAERRRERREAQSAPSFEVVSGGGLDARARAGVSPQFVARVRAVVLVAAALIVLGMARVALSSATVSLLSANSELSAQVEETQSINEQLRIQRSALASNSRISRIATQNYGMVLSGDFVAIDLDAEPAAEQASDPTDGDAAQTTDVTAPQADLS